MPRYYGKEYKHWRDTSVRLRALQSQRSTPYRQRAADIRFSPRLRKLRDGNERRASEEDTCRQVEQHQRTIHVS